MKDRRGFTLVELMVVISIIGILAGIALPAFLGQRLKAKTREGDILAGDLRKDVLEFYWHTGRFPKDNAEAGLPEPGHIKGKYVESITVKDGVITVSYNESLEMSYELALRPAVFVNDPTATVLWSPAELPEGMVLVGEGPAEAGEPGE